MNPEATTEEVPTKPFPPMKDFQAAIKAGNLLSFCKQYQYALTKDATGKATYLVLREGWRRLDKLLFQEMLEKRKQLTKG